jgi:hypothetical protein
MLCYFTPLPSRGGYAEALAGGFPYLASQSGEQSSIGFQPVSSVDYGWLAFLSGPPISDCLNEKIEVGWWFDTGWKPMLLYAVASFTIGCGLAHMSSRPFSFQGETLSLDAPQVETRL